MRYCVYVTCYKGSRLPIFYIGSTTVDKINAGYRGSVQSRQYKKIWLEEIKKPHLFSTKIIRTFATRSEAVDCERRIHQKLDVVNSSLYVNMAVAGKDFFFNSHHTEESKRKTSATMSGKKHSKEHSLKISQSLLGVKKSDDHKSSLVKAWEKRDHNLKESHKQKISSTMKGVPRTESAKKNISLGKKGKPQQKVTCPHCEKVGGICAMKQYHFDKCKLKRETVS